MAAHVAVGAVHVEVVDDGGNGQVSVHLAVQQRAPVRGTRATVFQPLLYAPARLSSSMAILSNKSSINNNNKKQEINTYSAQKLWPHGARMGFRNTSWHTAQYRCRDIASLRTNCRCINQCVKFEILVILQRITKTFQKSINIT